MDGQSGNPHGEHGRFEQILSQFLLKSLHMILDSRVPSIHPYDRKNDQVKKSDKWFSLVLGDRPAALDNLSFWHRNLMDPMIIDIILVQDVPNYLSQPSPRAQEETVIERWVVQFDYVRTATPQGGDSSAAYKKTYKKLIILLRSLFSMMRLLPAHRAFRKLCSSSKSCDYDINYKVSSFSAPFSRSEEELMKQYSFSPVEAHQGCFSISVTYRESLSDFNLETSALFPPQIISDYVGSPATDPLRAFPSAGTGVCATSFPSRGIQSTSTHSERPHSWTSGIHRGVSLPHNQPLSGSPPIYYSSGGRNDLSSSPTDIYGHRIPNYRFPNHYKNNNFDAYQLSPPFSPSTSPSPPTHLTGGNFMQSRLRSESSPVSIPHPILGRSPRYLSPTMSDTSRHSLPPLSPRNAKHDSSSQESPSGMRSLRKLDLSRAGELNSGIPISYTGQKLSGDNKDDSGRFSGLLSSSGSPRIGFSRSSSRISFQDDLDDCDFSCPFIVDDVDTSDHQASQNLDRSKTSEVSSQVISTARKSHDAAVGALVHMFRTAPPLRQDSSCYSSMSLKQELEQEAGSSSAFFLPRKTSDALEELRAYKDMKDLLLSKSARVAAKEEA